MKINVVTSIARQIDGEYVFVKIEGAFVNALKAENLMQNLKKSMSKDGKAVPTVVNVNNEKIECLMEIGAFEIELEE
jgi:hypothetical protein